MTPSRRFFLICLTTLSFRRFTHLFSRALYFENNVPFRLYLGFHLRDFLKIHISLLAHALQRVQVSLRLVNNYGHFSWRVITFSAVSRLPLEGFSWKFKRRIFHACCTRRCLFGCDSCITKGTFLRERCAFWLYLGFRRKDFLNLYLILSAHALQTLQFRLGSGCN